MEQLLPYYENELAWMRGNLREFAERYPRIAGRLLISGEVCEDPHTERMIESFAFLNARIARRLDDDYPQFTEALFEVLYPHYLRPFPSCSIARFDFSEEARRAGRATIARGTRLNTRAVRGVACIFSTVYPVEMAPVVLERADFHAIGGAPESVRLPPGATSRISIRLSHEPGGKAPLATLRLFLDGEPSFVAALRDALLVRPLAAWVQPEGGHWLPLDAVPLRGVGFDEQDTLVDYPARSHAAYRLLTEYFCFPEKFNFVDLDLAAIARALPAGAGAFTLHLGLGGIRSDSNLARMLGTLAAKHIVSGCTPVINLFPHPGEPVRVTHASASYPVLVDARRAYAFEVHAVESVHAVRQTPQGETVVPFQPFYSLRHAQTPGQHGNYWALSRDDGIAERSPGFETALTIVDLDFDPADVETTTLNIELCCTNRDLPAQLDYGRPDGDLFSGAAKELHTVTFLRKPTPSWRFPRGRGAHWRLISLLSLNHLSLEGGGVDAFREMLALHDLPRSNVSQRQIGGIVAISHDPTTAWLSGNPFNCLVRGVEVRLRVDEEAFVGSGVHAFAHIVERFLALYVHANSFTQLVMLSNQSGEELLRCPPRSGNLNLL